MPRETSKHSPFPHTTYSRNRPHISLNLLKKPNPLLVPPLPQPNPPTHPPLQTNPLSLGQSQNNINHSHSIQPKRLPIAQTPDSRIKRRPTLRDDDEKDALAQHTDTKALSRTRVGKVSDATTAAIRTLNRSRKIASKRPRSTICHVQVGRDVVRFESMTRYQVAEDQNAVVVRDNLDNAISTISINRILRRKLTLGLKLS